MTSVFIVMLISYVGNFDKTWFKHEYESDLSF